MAINSCKQYRPLLPWYVAGHLPQEQQDQIAAHLQTCPHCRQELADWRAIAGARQLIPLAAGAHRRMWEALRAQIHQEPEQASGGGVRTFTPRAVVDLGLVESSEQEELEPHSQRRPARRSPFLTAAATLLVVVLVVSLSGIFTAIAHRAHASQLIMLMVVMSGTDTHGIPQGYLRALRASDSTEIWRTSTLLDPGSPVIAGGTIYLPVVTATGTDRSGWTELLALNVSTGTIRWQFAFGQLTSPVLATDRAVSFGTTDHTTASLITLNAADGHVRWTAPLRQPAMSLLSGNGLLYATLSRPSCTEQCSRIAAYGASDGHAAWSYVVDNNGGSTSPVLVGTTLYLYTSDTHGSGSDPDESVLVALNAQNGLLRWRHVTGNGIGCGGTGCAPIIAQGMLYVTTDIFAGFTVTGKEHVYRHMVLALRASDGQEIWRTEQVAAALLVSDHVLLVTVPDSTAPTANTTLYAYDAITGTERWHVPDVHSFTASDGMVFYTQTTPVGATNGKISALDLRTGAQRWTQPMEEIPSQLTWLKGVLYVVAHPQEVNFYSPWEIAALRASDGKPLWNSHVTLNTTQPPSVAVFSF
jgi:outer membrane protein assembly factor BamB